MDRDDAIAALESLPPVTRISIADLKPTDVIVIECDGQMTQQYAENIRIAMGQVWPNHKVVILPEGLRLRFADGEEGQ